MGEEEERECGVIIEKHFRIYSGIYAQEWDCWIIYPEKTIIQTDTCTPMHAWTYTHYYS